LLMSFLNFVQKYNVRNLCIRSSPRVQSVLRTSVLNCP
jgi:hypothetical protein